jgi:hypothetical protein
MPLFRYAVFILLVLAALILTAARNPQQPKSPANPEAHAVADKLLGDAVARLDPSRAPWTETKLWQQGRLGRHYYEVDGRLVSGPNRRLRLELTINNGHASSTNLTVCDGIRVWQGSRVGDGPWTDLVHIQLKQLFQQLPTNEVRLHDASPRVPGITGITTLLHGLRSRMYWSRADTVRRGNRSFIKLTGAWSQAARATLAPPDQLWPVALPRSCRLYLDPSSLWPHRLEWWGPDAPPSADVLLLQMEFRDPIINQTLSEDRCAQEFTFPASVDQKTDSSPETLDRLRQLLAPPIPGH